MEKFVELLIGKDLTTMTEEEIREVNRMNLEIENASIERSLKF